ncbi:putative tetratricopeptide-like helical domain, DYW domain-containing protein [Rosa chinensis]|uniref:Putative tetratricopeptide-like helical domain, DYW domain-containing protein n=1 Tax=Rosa chinensis TaxID=74649 RepID=A0A2P6QE79_ROSCH|nr:pentatricopeptide repeat-containing protein At4g13650 [Rosa chinensis]XP_024199562.1 pentatricopeptide repeat-containing protein At4g13650 [Rosa chinensis]XP_024199567.1 pentatricopeptide repeat-containing protein At4g13650 [Rosa chinensis]XP_024199568.1 pentatricopeptide repeat-containing protein At4g13650 [Rosa chinensis]XP_040375489.1 pentatricopeptide repeat-containing protein At4g13650 [Rosa chinensis]XP_040375490.1 pentatricopeptide repeat-containing protein At4g13650 [Rosa chinensis]
MSGCLRSLMLTVNQCHNPMFFHRYRLHFRTKPKPTSVINLRKHFCGSVVSLSLAEYSNAANARVSDDYLVHQNEGGPKGIDLLHSMEARCIRANSQTYIWLLKGCLSSGSLLDARKLHSRILKLGFGGEYEISDLFVGVYLANDDSCSAVKVFDDLPYRSLFSWNNIIHGFLAKKLTGQVLGFFSRMVAENVRPDETTFAGVLRACGGGNASIQYVEQIHARIIRHCFGTSLLVCNPLIDLYAKNSSVDSAKKVFDKLNFRDSVSWVAIISGLSRNGREEEAVLLFIQMHTSGIFPTPYVFSSVISACAKIELFELGEQLQCLVFKGGFSCETYVCNALVTLYSRSGNFISAEQVFNTMWYRDGVSYNSLISGLAQCGFSDRALELFKKMQSDCMEPDCVTIASLLSACASVGYLYKGKQLHSYAIKAGMSSDIILEGSLLDLYVKCSDLQTAYEFFLTTETENVVLWNVMLVAYGQQDDLIESFHIFKQMHVEGMIPNQYTYPSILRTCTSVGALNLGEQVHTQAIKTGFQFNAYVCSVLIDMYAKHGKLDTALGILRRLTEDDVVSWTAMIAGYAQHDLFAEALLLFEEMQNRGIRSDNIGFSSAISSCAGIQALNQGRQIHAQSCISGYSTDLSVGNALVTLYARCGRIWEAYQAFEKIDVKDNISWNGLISGFGQSGYCEEALQLFSQMHRAGVEANLFTFGSAVSAAANLANIKQGEQIHAMVIKTGNNSEAEVSNALITLYSKCGSVDDAKREFIEMPEKNEISWNAMITGYSQHGHGIEALHLFEQMKQLGVVPSHVTFVGVLSACSHVGLVSEGLAYFESMSKEHGLLPKAEHYACVVDLLSRAGSLSQARKFITEMPIKPDSMIWRTLLSACIAKKNTEIGEVAARHLLELEPEDSATYVLISNMYAVAGMWGYRDQARQLMKERGVKKEPGRSWIEVKNSVHAFYVGDRLHPLANKIYEFLGDLNERAAEIGYVEDRNNLWNDMEQQHKDPTVYIHSEKLAIAFGLISLSNTIPIRVIKNLRVCNDCHNWIKHTSKISKRTIIVRDAYRFHHFKDGVCSCKDYW